MKLLLKILGINILAFFAYVALIEILTRDSVEGFLFIVLYTFFVGTQVLINLILTIIAAIRKSQNLKYYLAGLLLSLGFVYVAYLIPNRPLF